MRDILGRMRLAIAKIGGPTEDAMVGMAEQASALLSAGDLVAAQRLMDELAVMGNTAEKAKDLLRRLEAVPPAAVSPTVGLQAELDALVARMPAAIAIKPGMEKRVTKLAIDARAAVDTNDPTYAAAFVAQLRDALDKAAAGGLPGGDSTNTAEWRKARDGLRAAMELVDGQISGLQAALRQHGNDVLDRFRVRMNGITGNHKVKLMAAVMDVGDGNSPASGTTPKQRIWPAPSPRILRPTDGLRRSIAIPSGSLFRLHRR